MYPKRDGNLRQATDHLLTRLMHNSMAAPPLSWQQLRPVADV